MGYGGPSANRGAFNRGSPAHWQALSRMARASALPQGRHGVLEPSGETGGRVSRCYRIQPVARALAQLDQPARRAISAIGV